MIIRLCHCFLLSLAYLALLVDVGVVDLGPEGDFGRLEGILGGKYDVYQEGPLDVEIKVGVVFMCE